MDSQEKNNKSGTDNNSTHLEHKAQLEEIAQYMENLQQIQESLLRRLRTRIKELSEP